MRFLLTLAAVCVLSGKAQAHFIWLSPTTNDDGSTTVNVFFGEDAADDDPSFLKYVEGVAVYQLQGDREPDALELDRTEESVSVKLPDFRGQSLFFATHDLGVMERGDARFRLKYYAKTGPAITSRTWQWTQSADDLRLDVVPALEGRQVSVTVTFDGVALAGALVKASGPEMEEFVGETDEQGQASFEMADAGIYSIRARHIEKEPGELDGKEYPETRHYTTVAVDVPTPLSPVVAEELASIDEPVTSFGAALAGDSLYVYGGHTGSAHSYSREEQGHSLKRLDLATRTWETLAEGPYLQGLVLVEHRGKLYRIGGFTAQNAEGEEHDLWSQTDVACYDPASQAWTELSPLPEPRSSFDAAVLGDAIFVVGGWSIQGDAESVWHTTAWRLDLSGAAAEWQALPSPPFRRRALAVAAHDGKLYAIGGMQEEGGPTRRVDVFDPSTGEWTQGPEILGDDAMTGFGASAFATGGRLYVSTIKGSLQRLSEDGQSWEMVGQTPTARFFHRLLPLDDDHLLVVGGANMGIGKFDEIEVLTVGH
mgnify:FL=1